MRKNVAGQHVAFQMVSKTDGSDVTTGTPTVYYTIDGGTQGTGTGTAAHEGNGQWSYAPAQAETNGNHVVFTMVLTNAVSQAVNVWPVAFNPSDAVRLGLTALPNAAAGAAGGLPTDSTGKTSFNDLDAAQVEAECDDAITANALINAIAGYIDTEIAAILADTQDIQSRIPAALASGRIIADAQAISTSTAAADNLEASAKTIVVDSVATGYTETTTTLKGGATASLSSVNDHYNGRVIIFTSGTLKDQASDITDYDGTTKVLTFTALTSAPSDGDSFVIV